MSDTPRIWVGCLASYNAGTLFGTWIDCDQDADDIMEEIAEKVLRPSPNPNVMVECPKCYGSEDCELCHGAGEVPSAEEWHICDCEGFQGWTVSRYESLETVAEMARMAEEYGAAFGAAMAHFDMSEVAEALTEKYRGVHESAADYAASWAEECGDLHNVPEHIQWCIDWEQYANNLDIIEVRVDGEVHIFDRY